MPEDDTRRWQRISRPVIKVDPTELGDVGDPTDASDRVREAPEATIDSPDPTESRDSLRDMARDPMQMMRACLAEVRRSPRDPDVRRRFHALAADKDAWEPLALLLADEARAAARPDVAAAFYEELVGVHENLDQAVEAIAAMEQVVAFVPDDVEQHDRLAWLYRRAGAWSKAGETFERVASLARDDRARAALHAAGKLYRDNGRLDRAVAIYRSIVARRPADVAAWRVLDELLSELGRWAEVAEVRATLAARVDGGVEKAALLRAQARALEQAGDLRAATELVATASRHAPDNVSAIVDYASVLARDGRGREAADALAARIAESIQRKAPTDTIAGMRLRLVAILADACADVGGASVVLDELLADAPKYVPALERLVAMSARDQDPRTHAIALLRYADALAPGVDQARAMIEAARRFRDAHDHVEAARAFERAAQVAPPGDELRRELDDARTEVAIERAAEASAAGDVATAEQRLRGLLEARPDELRASLALAELLADNGRVNDAAAFLQATLAATTPDMPGPQLAPLVRCYARIHAALGDPDEAHALLHEAHRLDRRSLASTLALGESCFARRLWREAALHLGALAEHPDVAHHAAGVAVGLVHAAQAEIRALRPGNADKRYEAAVRIDPSCAPAWRALADSAIARGETARAIEYFEREARSMTDARARVRLFDALGDLALDKLNDAATAERSWMQIADARIPAVLDKLLAVQRRRGAGAERGETCERLAELQSDKRAARTYLEEAAQAYAAGGDVPRARATAERVMQDAPRDVDAIACASGVMMTLGDPVRAAMWLRRAFTAWDAAGDRGDGDPRRADLWRRLGDAERDRGDPDAARVAYERALATDPESDGALGARRGIVTLGGLTADEAIAMLAEVIENEQEAGDMLDWARALTRTDRIDDARAGYELARVLGAELVEGDERWIEASNPRTFAPDEAYGARLDAAERHDLIDDPADAPLGDLLELVHEAASHVYPDARTALARADLEAARIPASNKGATPAMYPQIANALGGTPTLLYATSSEIGARVLASAPPIIALGPALTTLAADDVADANTNARVRFELGRLVEQARGRRVLAASLDADAFARFIAALRHLGASSGGSTAAAPPAVARDVADETERLRQTLPVSVRRRVVEKLATLSASSLDPAAYRAACDRAADRAGLLACGRIDIAITLAGGPSMAGHLVRWSATARYLAARRKLRPRRA